MRNGVSAAVSVSALNRRIRPDADLVELAGILLNARRRAVSAGAVKFSAGGFERPIHKESTS